MESAKSLVENYCVMSDRSQDNFADMKNLKKRNLKKVASLIEIFIDNLLKMAEMDFCPMPFCHMEKEEEVNGRNGRKRKYTTGLKCETPFHFKGDDQWPKRFIPQMYHILQDYGLFFVYLDIPPKYRFSKTLSILIPTVISQKRTEITQATLIETHLSRVEFLKKLQLRLQKVMFLRSLYANCCTSTNSGSSSGKEHFNNVLSDFDKTIKVNMDIENDALERITNPSSSEDDSDSDSDE